MKFGIALSTQHRPGDSQVERFHEHVEQVRVAREVGFSLVGSGQHYMAAPFSYFQTIPTLARIAAVSGDMMVATGALVLPLHQPVDLAEQLATLDVITGGRFIFGAALGYRDVENQAFQHDPRSRVGRMKESLQIIKELWTGEPVTCDGQHFQLDKVQISMPPIQRPRPAIWLAANADIGVKRAARWGDAWIMNPHATLDTLVRQMALFHETRAAAGLPRAGAIPLGRECYIAPTMAQAVAEGRPLIEGKYDAYRRWGQDEAMPEDDSWNMEIEELAKDRFVIGDPARVRDEVARYREKLGLTHMVFRLQWPGMDHDSVLRSIRLLGEQVLPHFA